MIPVPGTDARASFVRHRAWQELNPLCSSKDALGKCSCVTLYYSSMCKYCTVQEKKKSFFLFHSAYMYTSPYARGSVGGGLKKTLPHPIHDNSPFFFPIAMATRKQWVRFHSSRVPCLSSLPSVYPPYISGHPREFLLLNGTRPANGFTALIIILSLF